MSLNLRLLCVLCTVGASVPALAQQPLRQNIGPTVPAPREAARPVPPAMTAEEMLDRLDRRLQDGPTDPVAVVDELAEACEPGLTAMPGGRFFGFVIGGTHPAALAVDWLVSAWDQNSGLRVLTPAHSAIEELTEAWLLDMLGLPEDSAVGFVTGGTMANFTCLTAARDEVLRRHALWADREA